MKTRFVSALVLLMLFAACEKKEPASSGRSTGPVASVDVPVDCGKEIVAKEPVKVGETGIMLPVGTKLCITKDEMQVRVELPEGFAIVTREGMQAERTLPYFGGTYACYCSGQGSACNVFYADGMGFGCLQSSCTGSCTGKFTYKGYSVERVAVTMEKEKFFALPEVQKAVANVSPMESYVKMDMYGFSFYVVNDEKAFLSKASCDCEGTKACKLKTVSLPLLKAETSKIKIYFCEGGCNGCELTIN